MMYIASGRDHRGVDDGVHEAPLVGGEDHLVAGDEVVDVAEQLAVAGAVTCDHHVARLTGQGGARPMTRALVERGQRDALEQRMVEADLRDLETTELGVRLGGARLGWWLGCGQGDDHRRGRSGRNGRRRKRRGRRRRGGRCRRGGCDGGGRLGRVERFDGLGRQFERRDRDRRGGLGSAARWRPEGESGEREEAEGIRTPAHGDQEPSPIRAAAAVAACWPERMQVGMPMPW